MIPRPVSLPKSTDFYRLPRPVQDRFAAATRGAAPPPPLLFHAASRGLAWRLLGSGAAVTLVAVLVLRAGIGDAKSQLALHGPGLLLLDSALFSVAAFAAVHALALLRRLDSLPYRAGTYLFPGCVVDARTPVLRVWPVAEVESTHRRTSPRLALELRLRDGSEVAVLARSEAELERAESALSSLKAELLRAVAEDDMHALAEMDPLHDTALSNPVGPTEAMKLSVPAWVRFDWAIALGFGCVLGLGLGTTRNDFSDDAMFRSAAASASIAAFKQYLVHGRRHAGEVRAVLLPRAELREAEASGGVDVLQAFARSHAASPIAPEINAAVRRALLAKLADAKKAGTITALDAFARRYPGNIVGPELAATRHALYGAALDAWAQKAHPDAATSAFFARLLAWAEKSGPECEVRFRFVRSKIDDADESVTKSARYPGPDALPSRYVVADAMRPREQRVAASLEKSFADAFAADVLTLSQGAPIDESAPLPPVRVPTVLIDYVAEWSHVNTVSTKPPSVFAGVHFTFDSTFRLPEGEPYEVKTKAWRAAEPWKTKSEGLSRQDFEQKVYDEMIDGAFDALDKRLTATLF